MAFHSGGDVAVTERLSLGWTLLAVAVFVSLVVAEYLGPIIGIAVAVTTVAIAAVLGTKLPRPTFPTADLWLVGILVLGLLSAVVANVGGRTVLDIDLQRDLGISLSYLLYFSVGYYFAYSRSTLRLLLIAVVAAGVLISVVHLARLGEVLSSGATNLYLFRLEAGRGSVTQFAALCATLVLLRDIGQPAYRRLTIGCSVVLVVSMLMTLSRGLMFLLIILALGAAGLIANRANRLAANLPRLLISAALAAAAVVVVYVLIRFFLQAVYVFLDEFFITRVVNSLTEVSGARLETQTQIADNYRAFELNQAMLQFDAQPALGQWVGQGWGSRVVFGLETASTTSNFSRTEASFLHNGYAYYLMKTGIVGVVLYAGFMCHLLVRAGSRDIWPATALALTQRKVLLVTTICLAVGTVATGGLGFPATYLGLAVLLGACYGPAWSSELPSLKTAPVPKTGLFKPGERLRRV